VAGGAANSSRPAKSTVASASTSTKASPHSNGTVAATAATGSGRASLSSATKTPSTTPTSTPTKTSRVSLTSPSSVTAKRAVTLPQFDESDFQQVLTNTIISQLDEDVDWEQRAHAMAQLALICDEVHDDYVLTTLSTARIALSLCSALSSPRSALVRSATKAVVALCRRCVSSKRWLRDDAIGSVPSSFVVVYADFLIDTIGTNRTRYDCA
jgi:hypothetical protein